QALLKKPDLGIDELIKHMPAPDFPTAGIIYGVSGVREGYRTGRGRILMRARTHFEDLEKGNRQAIIIDEIPYQVNKAVLLARIGELANEKKIEGIAHVQDESDKSGMRVVIELKRGEIPEVILNNLFKQTQLEDTFGVNMVALQDGQPRVLNLKEMLHAFLAHRREVVTRRTLFDLREARKKAHIQEGLAVALCNISSTTGDFQAFAISATFASGGVWDFLMRAMISSTLERATASPSWICAFFLASRPEG